MKKNYLSILLVSLLLCGVVTQVEAARFVPRALREKEAEARGIKKISLEKTTESSIQKKTRKKLSLRERMRRTWCS